MSRPYRSNRNVVFSCKFHIVWCPKYRRSVLVDGADERLKKIIARVCAAREAQLIELEVMPDHVHLLVDVDPQYGVHRLVKEIKGSSSRELRRLERLREGPAWAQACAMPRIKARKPNKERAAAFAAARAAAGFTAAAISAFGTRCKNEAKWNDGRARMDARVGAHECQLIAQQAFSALERYAFGQRGRPRFKGKGRPLHSLQGKSADSGIYWNPNIGCLEWGALRLRAKLPPPRKDPWLERALARRTKFARILWRQVKGRRRWFVQLAQEGVSPQKYQTVKDATVGLDVGPSTLAVVSDRAVALVPLAPEVQQPWAATRRLQRAMDRSRRATNEDCYNADGTFKSGARIAVRSRGYLRLKAQLSETERVLQKRRARSHGRLSNCILGLGHRIQTEKLNYTAFQKRFGRSTQVKAVGSLMLKLRRKAERAGGEFRELNTRALKLSQYDHCTGTCTKKHLSQRFEKRRCEPSVEESSGRRA